MPLDSDQYSLRYVSRDCALHAVIKEAHTTIGDLWRASIGSGAGQGLFLSKAHKALNLIELTAVMNIKLDEVEEETVSLTEPPDLLHISNQKTGCFQQKAQGQNGR